MLLSTQGPFPPRTLPRFPGTTDPSATLTARPAPRGVPVDLCCISVRASRVAALFLFHACRRQYPDGNGSVPVSLASPSANGLPLLTGGSASVLPVSRPARRSLAFRPAWSLNRPRRPFFAASQGEGRHQENPRRRSPECFSPCRYLHGPPWLLPTGATVVGRGSHPPEEGAFPRRTVKDGLGGHVKSCKEVTKVIFCELPLDRSSRPLVMTFELPQVQGKSRQPSGARSGGGACRDQRQRGIEGRSIR